MRIKNSNQILNVFHNSPVITAIMCRLSHACTMLLSRPTILRIMTYTVRRITVVANAAAMAATRAAGVDKAANGSQQDGVCRV